MTKEDLNRQFGDPEKQKPVTPLDLLAAAHLIKDHCNNIPIGGCLNCIFYNKGVYGVYGCMLFEPAPRLWGLLYAESRVKDWIKEQCPEYGTTYLDTDKYTDE